MGRFSYGSFTMPVRVAVTALVAFFALLCIMPFVWMISTSFKYEIDVMNFPFKLVEEKVNLSNYGTVWFRSNFPLYYLNSIKVTGLSLLGNLFLTTMAAYAFGRLRFRGKEIIFALYLATMMIPEQVTILPKYLYFSAFRITNNHLSLILPAILVTFTEPSSPISAVPRKVMSRPCPLMKSNISW